MSAHAPKRAVPVTYTQTRVERIAADRRLEAAKRLVARPGAGRPADAARRFVEAAESHGIDLTHFWGAITPAGVVAHAALVVVGAPRTGRTAMVFTSPVVGTAEERELAAVIDRACRQLDGVRLVQALLEPHERGPMEAFRLAGFRDVGELAYLQRPWQPSSVGATAWPAGVTVEGWRPGDDALVVEALERSYVDTLDCPELCGLREAADVLDSHRATGRFDPALWWLVRLEGRPAGALLLNPCPAQDHTELVYLGVCPELRGRGLGGRLLDMGLSALGGRAHRTVTLAVDTRNEPARRVYAQRGFVEFARRFALVRPADAPGAANAGAPAR